MNWLHILLTVMVVMLAACFAGHEALAKVLTGTGGDDTLVGTNGSDRFKGSRGNDHLWGGRGNDHLRGSRGDDTIKGDHGNDTIIPGEDDDTVHAGYGDDRIYARDTGDVDHISCGPGFDKVETVHVADKTLSNCERVLGRQNGNID
jgi:Ca2+-binding RTX toxin-like protein